MLSIVAAGILLTLAVEAAAQDAGVKSQPPSGDALDEALNVIREVFGADYEKAKTSDQKKELARTLIIQARQSVQPVNRFALLNAAKDIATQAGDRQWAFLAIEDMDAEFELDALVMKAGTLVAFSKQARSTAEYEYVAVLLLALEGEACVQERFDVASKLGEMALSDARKSKNGQLTKRALARLGDLEAITKVYEQAQDASEILKEKPADPNANLIVGKYTCFIMGDWDRGLPMLALCSDAALAGVATNELEGTAEPLSQMKLGDTWWDLAEDQDGYAERSYRQRSAYWYRRALPNLSGLSKSKVEKRLDKAAIVIVLLKDGRPLVPISTARTWEPGKGFLEGVGEYKGKVGGGVANALLFDIELGDQDFVLEITMSLEMIGKTMGRVQFVGKTWGQLNLDSWESGHIGFGSDLFDMSRKDTDVGPASQFIRKGVPFRITLRRQGTSMLWSIDDKTIAKLKLTESQLGQFGVTPWAGTMRLYQVVLRR